MTPHRKVFAYVVRSSSRGAELLVFDSLDEAGVEIPKGVVEPAETLEAALRRELLEQAGFSAVRAIDELGNVRYRDEE